MPVASASWAAAAADGASPRTWPSPAVQSSARTLRAVVLPAPAGARTSWTRRRSVATVRTICFCPASRTVPVARTSARARSTAAGARAAPSVRAAGVHDPLLGGEDPGGGVLGAADHGEHRRPIPPPLLGRQVG